MMPRASFAILLSGCAAAASPPRTVITQPAATMTVEDETLPAPSLLDTMREQILCNGRCPPLSLERPPSSGFELTLWRCGRDFKVTVTSHGTVLRERHGEILTIHHIEPAAAEALGRSFESAGEAVERQHSVVRPVDALFKNSMQAREYVTMVKDDRELVVVGPACVRSRDAGAFPLADAIDRAAHVID
jgi:hypothetical protein